MAELSTLARPYAKAAFEFAADAGDLQGWSQSLSTAGAVAQQPAVVKLLSSPSSTAAQQAAAVVEICGDELGATGQNFISILSENRRLQLLPQISHQFEIMKANREKAVDVELVAAHEMDAEQQQKLSDALSAKLERKVNMQVSLDKSLLGGAVIRAGDTVIDGSIRGRLTKLAESLNS
ncbi:F0F1 ATP synthase subunit delta [SAR92 clade bacterium H231]|jgi:F-type H+-transporting ATPase subunit delta|nr:F0F1 ATP synthase subunit delta [Porticoccaceae bacterium]MCT2532948.1 F0F1 ATP synthase subunit delta [SAR92 clade bacterium H231]MDA7753286.1 F0F1 ATP synthase subunit delta [bacterium]MBT7258110.1 F0F1 ATP synthase subunit delta [Porticoccaceae bacterium]MBT7905619.1 F0F1 ATP synthase subunit delta [Porticoccaceae bacterium]